MTASDLKTGKGPNGRALCRWCGTETKPPRRSWCSEACVDEYLSRSSSQGLRARVWVRDRGVCALCGIDTDRQKRIYEHALRALKRMFGRNLLYRGYWGTLVREMGALLGRDGRGHFWEADHITPVVEGGGKTGPENARTLCLPCHKSETAALARRRARERRDRQRGLLG